jgi:hypothetical protein
MGYTTEFRGQFDLDKPLTPEHFAFLKKFASTRRMARFEDVLSTMEDPIREAAKLPLGLEGGYFVGSKDQFGQDFGHKSVRDSNGPPMGQPGLWCQWVPNYDGTAIEWNEAEKFYNYIEWIEYLVTHFLAPWGYKLNGVVEWRGEEWEDTGKITIKNNKVKSRLLK